MPSHEQIEEILKADLEHAKSRYDSAKREFMRICNDIPSGLPHPDGTQRIQNARRDQTAAKEAFSAALRRFNAFILRGKIPIDLDGE